MHKNIISIITPTYNRASLLPTLYNSLIEQTDKGFEWIIIDDGSTDDTESVIKSLVEQDNIDIQYIKKKNGGKHSALNIGIKAAKGYLTMIVDSDDYLTNTAIATIKDREKTIKSQTDLYAGVAFNKMYKDGSLVGHSFDSTYVDATSLERDKYKICGDKEEVFYTNILKEFPFPEFDNENFLTEAIVWYRIANAGYKIRWFNQPIYVCEYLPEGLTKNLYENYRKNPLGFKLFVKECLAYKEISIIKKLKLISLYSKIIYGYKELNKTSEELGISKSIVLLANMVRRFGEIVHG